MRRQQIASLGVSLSLLLASVGCNCWQRNPPPRPADPLYQRDASSQPVYPPSYPPYPPDPRYVPVPTPGAGMPGSPEVLTPQPYPQPGAQAIPNPAPSSSGYGVYPGEFRPNDGSDLAPTPGRAVDPSLNGRATSEPPLARSTPLTPPAPKEPTKLPPDLTDPKVADRVSPLPPVKDGGPSPTLPVGIPSFAEPKARIATGLKPDTEGLDWLQNSKYRMVVHLRRKGADDSADREQVEKRGMKYQSIEISPETLNREIVDEFNKLVDNPANQPAFVYDKDRLLTGVMWYLHYRIADKLSDDDARSKAELLGLKVKDGEEQTAYWVAIESMLADKP
jgi:hypothetical protein